MKLFLESVGVKHIRTSLYHPRSNGLVERVNCVIKDQLQVVLINKLNWKKVIADMLWAMRSTPHISTGVSPFTLMRGRVARTALNREWMGKTEIDTNKCEQVLDVRKCVQKGYVTVQPYKSPRIIRVGDWVRVKSPRHIRKGLARFSAPLRVKLVKEHVVTLEDNKTWNKSMVTIVPTSKANVVNDRLRRCGVEPEIPREVKKQQVESTRCRRSTRVPVLPGKFKDFDMKM